jgi:ribosome biogenesis GTPase
MQLALLGWDDRFAAALAFRAPAGTFAGRVLQQYNHIYELMTETGEVRAQVAGRLRHQCAPEDLPVTGDWVAVRVPDGGGDAVIQAVLPRRTCFSRQAAGRVTREQVLAANLDVVFLVVGLDNDFSPRRVERYLAAAWNSGALPIVVLNKVDLCAEAPAKVSAIEAISTGTAVHAVSALHGDGLEAVAAYCSPGRTAALLGSSGVGKSTLINRLSGVDVQATQPVRPADQRGRHTTTRRELFFLPGGGMIIDTPGLRELQLWNGDEGVQRTFDEIGTLAAHCRFRDCRHQDEPGCAVREAVAAGQLDPDRLTGMQKLQQELAWLDRRHDQIAALAEKKRWKAIHKAANRFQRESPKRT